MIDVVVLSRDRPDLFAECRARVAAQGVPFRGWLVDNGTDGTTADDATKAGWEVISPGRNTGFAEGNNLAIAEGSGERVLLLNNDAFLHDGALAALVGHSGITASVNVNGDGRVNFAGGGFRRGLPAHRGRNSTPGVWSCGPSEWVTFACVLIDRSVLDEVGPLDEGYWYGFEDVDFCVRASAVGVTPWVCADAVVTHDESTTRGFGNGWNGNVDRFVAKWGLR